MVNIFAKMGIFLPESLIFNALGMGMKIPMDGDLGGGWESAEVAHGQAGRRTESRGRLFMERMRADEPTHALIAGRSLGPVSNET